MVRFRFATMNGGQLYSYVFLNQLMLCYSIETEFSTTVIPAYFVSTKRT